MSELALPSRMTVDIDDGDKSYTVYLSGENPQQDGTLVYRSRDKKIQVVINPKHKAVWP